MISYELASNIPQPQRMQAVHCQAEIFFAGPLSVLLIRPSTKHGMLKF